MQKGIFVKDMAAPNEAEGVFVITLAAQGSSRNGPYWRLVLADASGSVEAKIWSPLSASFPALHTGSFFYAHGRVSTFRDQLQFTVEEGRLLSPEEGAEGEGVSCILRASRNALPTEQIRADQSLPDFSRDCTFVGRPQMLMKPADCAWSRSLSPKVTRFSEYRELGEVMPALIMLPL